MLRQTCGGHRLVSPHPGSREKNQSHRVFAMSHERVAVLSADFTVLISMSIIKPLLFHGFLPGLWKSISHYSLSLPPVSVCLAYRELVQ
jgi:hypothetical protein